MSEQYVLDVYTRPSKDRRILSTRAFSSLLLVFSTSLEGRSQLCFQWGNPLSSVTVPLRQWLSNKGVSHSLPFSLFFGVRMECSLFTRWLVFCHCYAPARCTFSCISGIFVSSLLKLTTLKAIIWFFLSFPFPLVFFLYSFKTARLQS